MPFSDDDLTPPVPRPTEDEVLAFLVEHRKDKKPWHTAAEVVAGLQPRVPPLQAVVTGFLNHALRNVQVSETAKEENGATEATLVRVEQHLSALVNGRSVERREGPSGPVFKATTLGLLQAPQRAIRRRLSRAG